MSEVSGSGADDTALPDYAGPVAQRRFKRIKLALFLSSMAACLGVTLLGLIGSSMVATMGDILGSAMSFDTIGSPTFAGGVYMGLQLAAYNFMLFFVTVPAAWLALGLSIGRLPYRGIVKRRPFVKWAIIWGVILVGGTTGGFGLLISLSHALGSFLAGSLIGATVGAGCGLLFYAIVKPANQIADVDVDVF